MSRCSGRLSEAEPYRSVLEAFETLLAGPDGRPLQSLVVRGGRRLDGPSLDESRAGHLHALTELPEGTALRLVRVGGEELDEHE